MNDTLLEFGGAAARPPDDPTRRRVCQVCGSRFSGDARFCPFDGEPLAEATASEKAADPLIGSVVDQRYRVLRVLGEGGMGTVYEVKHTTLQRHFALKALRRDLGRDKDLSARFIQEAKAAAAVSHPSIVQIADFGHLPSGEAYFVMEMLDGVPLSTHIRERGAIPPARAVPILRQISEALSAAHGAGIIHRDLKPDNIHVCSSVGERDLVKVLDFGLAKVAGASKLTRAGMVFGTPHYMSPEQAAGDPIDHRSDIYALGVVMYEMLTGRVPFESDTFMGVLTKHMHMLPTPPSELVEDTSTLGVLEDITLRCLQKKPESRFSTMLELLEQLEKAVQLDAEGHPVVRPSDPPSAPQPRSLLQAEFATPTGEELEVVLPITGLSSRKARVLAAGVGVAAVACLIAIGAWLFVSSPTPAAESTSGSSPSSEAADARAPAPAAAAAAAAAASSVASAEPAPPDAASPPAGSSRGSRAGVSRRSTKRSKKGAAKSTATGASKAKKTRRKRPKIGGGDIVDPWEN